MQIYFLQVKSSSEVHQRCRFCQVLLLPGDLSSHHCRTHEQDSIHDSYMNSHPDYTNEDGFFSCHYCAFTTMYKGNLNTHLMKHTGEKPYSCSLCSYRSSKKQNLHHHLLTHTGERPHRCQFCFATFSHKSNYIKHMRKHSSSI